MSSVLHQLMSVLEDRKINPPPNSYTAKLYAGGDAKIGGENHRRGPGAGRSRRRTGRPGPAAHHLRTSDLIYHLLVLLAHHGIKLDEVETEIARRFGQSGLDEKARAP